MFSSNLAARYHGFKARLPQSRAARIAAYAAFFVICALAGGAIGNQFFKSDPLDGLDNELDRAPAFRDFYYEAVDRCVGECQLERLNEKTLALRGRIRSETYVAFMSKIDNRVTDLVVNMVGGDVETALRIADEIDRRQLRVIVRGFCLSSCANYLFIAGSEKILHGILGYHGSAQGADRDAMASGVKIPSRVVPMREKAFFARIGISEKLFDVTQSNNKGFDKGVGMYAPSAATLRALGVKNIVGDQDEVMLDQADQIFKKTRYKFMSFGRDPNPAFADLTASRR